jgi:predicted metal-dependent phosphoesterase TrpH
VPGRSETGKLLKNCRKWALPYQTNNCKTRLVQGWPARPHVARLLVKNNIVKNNQQAFSRYLKAGRCAYVSRFVLDSSQAINVLHDAGGYAVLAHPAQLSCSFTELSGLIQQLKRLGIDGLETYYPTQRGDSFKKIRALAEKYELLETGGSDYHGDTRPGTSMAGATKRFVVPDTVMKALHKKRHDVGNKNI